MLDLCGPLVPTLDSYDMCGRSISTRGHTRICARPYRRPRYRPVANAARSRSIALLLIYFSLEGIFVVGCEPVKGFGRYIYAHTTPQCLHVCHLRSPHSNLVCETILLSSLVITIHEHPGKHPTSISSICCRMLHPPVVTDVLDSDETHGE